VSSLAIFKEFRSTNFLQSRYQRSKTMEIWDANLHDNAIRPFKCPQLICDSIGDMKSIMVHPDCECVGVEEKVQPVQGFCQDQYYRVINSTLYEFSECDPYTVCQAGSPSPTEPPSVSGGGCGCDAIAAAYCITYVTRFGSLETESSPSPPSSSVMVDPSAYGVTVSIADPPESFCVTSIRIYRTESQFEDGNSEMPIVGAEWVQCGEVEYGVTSFADGSGSCSEGAPLTTHDPMAFPAPPCQFVCRTEDGIAVADTHRVYISNGGQAMFSTDGVVNIEDEIRCIQSIGNTIFVLTDKFPVKITYQLTGSLISINRVTIQRNLPLVSYASVSTYGTRVYFASEYSLYAWDTSGYGGDLKSPISELLTPHQWKMLEPSTVVGTGYEYGYFLTSKKLKHSLMLEFGGEGTDTRVLTHVMPISYIDADVLNLDHDGHIVYTQSGALYRWDYREQEFCTPSKLQDSDVRNCSACCPYSARFYYDHEGMNSFKVVRIEWDERSASQVNASFRFEHFGGTEHEVEFEVVNSRAFALPDFSSTQACSIEVSGCATITEIRLATSYPELVNRSNNAG